MAKQSKVKNKYPRKKLEISNSFPIWGLGPMKPLVWYNGGSSLDHGDTKI